MKPLLSVAEARNRLLTGVSPVSLAAGEIQRLEIQSAMGRILAEAVRAPFDLPLFANSAMDGFAVRAVDVTAAAQTTPVQLEVVADIPAGFMFEKTLEPGEAARIMTGAPVPPGADAVVPVEDSDHHEYDPGTPPPRKVRIFRPVQPGANVRPAGVDLQAGELVLSPGRRLAAHDIGMLAMCGLNKVPVYPLPEVAILSTGDELLGLGQSLEPGKIYESNGVMLAGLVAQNGARPHLLGTAPDQPDAIRALLEQARQSDVDLILTSAGVSVGAFDYLRMVIENHGELDFWRVNMRPGKPLMVGSYGGTRLVGLPGNPVSAFVGFEVFVRPLLERLSGQADRADVYYPVRLLEDIRSDGRESYLRAVVEQEGDVWVARLTGNQGSGNLHSLVKANAILRIPAGVLVLQAGEVAMARLLHQILSIESFIGDQLWRQEPL